MKALLSLAILFSGVFAYGEFYSPEEFQKKFGKNLKDAVAAANIINSREVRKCLADVEGETFVANIGALTYKKDLKEYNILGRVEGNETVEGSFQILVKEKEDYSYSRTEYLCEVVRKEMMQ